MRNYKNIQIVLIGLSALLISACGSSSRDADQETRDPAASAQQSNSGSTDYCTQYPEYCNGSGNGNSGGGNDLLPPLEYTFTLDGTAGASTTTTIPKECDSNNSNTKYHCVGPITVDQNLKVGIQYEGGGLLNVPGYGYNIDPQCGGVTVRLIRQNADNTFTVVGGNGNRSLSIARQSNGKCVRLNNGRWEYHTAKKQVMDFSAYTTAGDKFWVQFYEARTDWKCQLYFTWGAAGGNPYTDCPLAVSYHTHQSNFKALVSKDGYMDP